MDIVKSQEADTLKLVVKGRIDTLTSASFQQQALPLPAGVKSMVIDMGGVEYVSSAGLRAFAMIGMAVKDAGGKLALDGLHPDVKTVFDMTGFSSMLGLA